MVKGKLIERKELITDPIYRLWRLQFHNNYGHGSVMFRKSAVIDIGMYDEKLLYARTLTCGRGFPEKTTRTLCGSSLWYRLIEQGQQASVRITMRSLQQQFASATETCARAIPR